MESAGAGVSARKIRNKNFTKHLTRFYISQKNEFYYF